MSNTFIGEIKMFGGNFAPRGFAYCNGQLLSIAQNSALFSLLGTTYGGDGVTTFGLPNLQGRIPIHPGQGPGLGNVVVGQQGGQENVTLTTNQMPAHNHTPRASAASGNQSSPANHVWAAGVPYYSSGVPGATLNPSAGGSAGGSQPHENMVPFQAVSFIIALEGIYPSRN